jgi:hypothetical protein
LQLTGNATEETWNIVNNGSADKTYTILHMLMINTQYGADELAHKEK